MAVYESAIALEVEDDEDSLDNNNSELQEDEPDSAAMKEEKQNEAEDTEMSVNGALNSSQSMMTRRRRSTAAGYRTTTHSAWEYVGQFATEDEVTELRHRLKVAVNSCVQQKKGLKTYFYCTKRGSYGCGFQMYSMQAEKDGPIALYKSGQHNHAINKNDADPSPLNQRAPLFTDAAEELQNVLFGSLRKDQFTMDKAILSLSQQAAESYDMHDSSGILRDALISTISKHVVPDSLQETSAVGTSGEVLQLNGEQLPERPQSTALEGSHQSDASSGSQFAITTEVVDDDAPPIKRPFGPKRMRKQAAPMRSTLESPPARYSLTEGPSIARLIQIASDLSLTVTFNAHKHGEFCFTAGSNGLQKSIVVTDTGATITIEEMFGDRQLDVEVWTKADFSQFAWAIKAKCQNALFP